MWSRIEDLLGKIVYISLAITVVAVLAVKFITGLALGPLLLIGLIAFGFAFGLTLRVDRSAADRN